MTKLAIGILGPEGRGLSFNLFRYNFDYRTFEKAFGSGGAFIASNSEIENILSKQAVFRYTTALALSLAAGALEGLKKF